MDQGLLRRRHERTSDEWKTWTPGGTRKHAAQGRRGTAPAWRLTEPNNMDSSRAGHALRSRLNSRMIEGSLLNIGVRILQRHGWLLVVCVATAGLLSTGYALQTPKQWQAKQTLLLQDQLLGNSDPQGRFHSLEQMKSIEETIRTIAGDPTAIRSALDQLGPSISDLNSDWLDNERVQKTGEKVAVVAPNGAEFGETEMLQLVVEANSPERSFKLASLLTEELFAEFSQLQDLRYRNLETEIENEIDIAQSRLETSTQELRELEIQIGEDLSELLGLSAPSGSEGPIRRLLLQTQQELINVRQKNSELKTQREYLQQLTQNPQQIASTPSSLLELHPELSQLKRGIVDASLALSALRAQYSDDHPRVLQTAQSQESLGRQLEDQLKLALRGTDLESDLVLSRQQELEAIESDLQRRSDRIAELRIPYSKALFQTQQRQQRLDELEREISAVQAARQSALDHGMISLVGQPQVSVHPVSTSRTLVVAAGSLAGFIFGLGLLAIVVDPRSLMELPASAPLPEVDETVGEVQKTLTPVTSAPGKKQHEEDTVPEFPRVQELTDETTALPTADEISPALTATEVASPAIDSPSVKPHRAEHASSGTNQTPNSDFGEILAHMNETYEREAQSDAPRSEKVTPRRRNPSDSA